MDIKNFEIIRTIPSFENKIYIVRKNTSDYIFKILNSHIAFQKELYTLSFLEGYNIAPNIIDFNMEDQSILIEFLHGEHYNYTNTRDIKDLGKLLKYLHEVLKDYKEIPDDTSFDINDCINNLEQELLCGNLLTQSEKFILIKTLKYIQNMTIENEIKGNIHHDIKPENIIAGKFIDFEKTGTDFVLKDIVRAVIRIGKGDNFFEKTLLDSYGHNSGYNDLKLLKIQDCLFSISYFIYKGHKNNYPFKDISFKILHDIVIG